VNAVCARLKGTGVVPVSDRETVNQSTDRTHGGEQSQARLRVNVVNIVNVIRTNAGELGAAYEGRLDCDERLPLKNNLHRF